MMYEIKVLVETNTDNRADIGNAIQHALLVHSSVVTGIVHISIIKETE